MITIDKMSRTPIYEQLIAQFEAMILSGDIGPEGKLPSVRQLSQELGINPNTLQRAYNEIERRGLCVSVPGNGRFLSRDANEKLAKDSMKQTERLEEELRSLKLKGLRKQDALNIIEKIFGEDKEISETEDKL
ncbi:MAG: GntR family transcriptional regulator [Clostridia bacterium]|nr:GntR family transcriptional regulator [Clostridia bacterium]